MDTIDNKLLILLQGTKKLSFSELGTQLDLSISAVGERIKKLKAIGIIKGHTTLVNPQAIGLNICAFIQIVISASDHKEYINKNLCDMPEVLEYHHTTGEYSYLLKTRLRDTKQLENLLKRITGMPGITKTNTSIVLSTHKEITALTIYES